MQKLCLLFTLQVRITEKAYFSWRFFVEEELLWVVALLEAQETPICGFLLTEHEQPVQILLGINISRHKF